MHRKVAVVSVLAWGIVGAACGGAQSNGPGPIQIDVGPESNPEEWASVDLFDDGRIHDVRLQMDPEDWRSIIEDSRGDEWREARLSIDGVVMNQVGVRPAGESSRVPGNPKMGLRVQFDAFRDAKMGGFDTIKLSGAWDDPFVARDRIAYWFLRQKMASPRISPAQLIVNGEVRGTYQIEERWDRDSVRERFSEPLGTLYRLRGVVGTDPYQFRGLEPALYVPLPWDPVGARETDDHGVIGRMLQVVGQDPANLAQVVDLDTLVSYFAGNAILTNTDGFTGDMEVDDHYQYYDPATGRFFILPWDPDNTFGAINDLPDRDLFKNYGKSVVTRLIRDTSLREQYFARLEEWMTAIVPLDRLHAEIDRVYGQIRETVVADTLKQYPTEHFDWSLGYVKDFISARYRSIQEQIDYYRRHPDGPPLSERNGGAGDAGAPAGAPAAAPGGTP